MRKSIALIYAALSAALSLSAAVPPAEKLLPDDTLAVISIPDVSKACEIYRNSPSGRFWSDPAMKPFKDKFFAKVQKECLDPLEHDLGIHFADFTNLLQGQFTLALIQNGWKGMPKDPNEPAFVIILDARDKAPQAATMLSDLKKKWLDSGKTAHIEKIRDVDFSMITLSTNDIPKSLKPKPDAADPAETTPPDSEPKHASKTDLYIGQSGSLLLIGSSPKPLEKILAAQSGSGVKTLTDQTAFTSSAPMFRDAYVFGWVNVKIFIDAIVRSEEDPDAATNPLGLSPSKIVTALGFNGLKSLAFNYRSTPEGAQFNLLLGVPEAQRTGIFKILAGEPKECNPPPFVPADAVKFQRWRINGPKTYDTLHSMIADISPQNAGGLDIFLNAAEAAAREKDPKFDLKKSLVGNLGDDLITYQKSPK